MLQPERRTLPINPDVDISVEKIIDRPEEHFGHLFYLNPSARAVVESLKKGYLKQQNDKFSEVWLRGLNLFNRIAKTSDDPTIDESDFDDIYMNEILETVLKPAMGYSLTHPESLDAALSLFKQLQLEQDTTAVEWGFYEILESGLFNEV